MQNIGKQYDRIAGFQFLTIYVSMTCGLSGTMTACHNDLFV